LKGATAAFEKVTEADLDNPDGWVNIGRCAVQEGDMGRARAALEKALGLTPNLARANYFYARVLRADSNYKGAAERLRIVLAQYPRDRVALNDYGRILFLQRTHAEAVKVLQSVFAIDPEDLQAHYNLMLCYSGLGNDKLAKEHEARYAALQSGRVSADHYRALSPVAPGR
jgi:tetratricopeptide (TPR) repeat protein